MQTWGIVWGGLRRRPQIARATAGRAAAGRRRGQTDNLAHRRLRTGEVALGAARNRGLLGCRCPVYRRGIEYLASPSKPDDAPWQIVNARLRVSSLTSSRGFPDDHDQWISQAGTAMAYHRTDVRSAIGPRRADLAPLGSRQPARSPQESSLHAGGIAAL